MAEGALTRETLPVGSMGRHSSGWWGVLCVVATEGAVFAYLLFTTAYLAVFDSRGWPPGGPPSLLISLPNTIILILSSVAVWWGQRGIRRGNRGQLALGLAVALVLGIVFVGLQFLEWHNKPFGISTNIYGSLFFTVTGFHVAHVVAGIVVLAALLLWTLLGLFNQQRHAAAAIGIIYWHFVDVVWLFVFFTFYITPYL